MGFYEKYKPFRNYMRQFDLVSGLVDVWRYSAHLIEGQILPPDYAAGKTAVTLKPVNEHIYPWDLDILARELVLNGGHGGRRSLKKWNDLAVAVNYMRRLDDSAFALNGVPQVDVIFELHRIAHRQFPWQMKVGLTPMMRAFKVFGEKAVEEILVRDLGMTAKQFLLLGMALRGHFLKAGGISTNQNYAVLGISKDASDRFFARITSSVEDLRVELENASPIIAIGSIPGTHLKQHHSSSLTRLFLTAFCARYPIIWPVGYLLEFFMTS